MARLFNDANNEYLEDTSSPVSTTPCTLACRFDTDDITRRQHMFAIGDSGGSNHMLSIEMRGDLGGDNITAYTFGGGGAKTATSTAGVSGANVWHHACAVFAASNDRAIYLNGGNKGTDNGESDATSIDMIRVARTTFAFATLYWSGRVAEVALWDVALVDDEAVSLAGGISPLRVRPESLVAYWSLFGIGSPEPDYRGTYDLTLFSGGAGPVVADHAPVAPQFAFDLGAMGIYTSVSPAVRIPRPPAAYNTLAIY